MKRSAPKNEDAERGLLGCLLIDEGGDILAKCREVGLTPAHFFNAAHQHIYEAIISLVSAGKPVGEIALVDELQRRGELNNAGGIHYLNELTRTVEVTAHALHWLELIREHHTRRRLILIAMGLVENAYNPAVETDKLIELASHELFDLSNAVQQVEDPLHTLTELESRFEDAVAGRVADAHANDKIGWGFPSLDKRFRQLCARTGDFLIGVFGDAGTGKSSFVDNMVSANIAAGKVVVKHALETSNANTILSLAALRGGVPVNVADDPTAFATYRKNEAPDAILAKSISRQRETYTTLRGVLGKTLFLHDHTREFGDIVAWTRRDATVAAKHGRKIDLVVVDYLQEVEFSAAENERLRSDEVLDRIARRLKALAKQLRCPVVLIASLNRATGGGRPTMLNIRGSGGIGFILDRAIALWRPNETAAGLPNMLTDETPTVDVWIEQFNKRNVPAWQERMRFNGPQKRFSEIPLTQKRDACPLEKSRPAPPKRFPPVD